jgi:hypothetical protein
MDGNQPHRSEIHIAARLPFTIIRPRRIPFERGKRVRDQISEIAGGALLLILAPLHFRMPSLPMKRSCLRLCIIAIAALWLLVSEFPLQISMDPDKGNGHRLAEIAIAAPLLHSKVKVSMQRARAAEPMTR